MSNETNQDPLAGMEEVKTQTVKWGKIGDWMRGTLADKSRISESEYGGKHKIQRVYEFKVKAGMFHGINKDKSIAEEPTFLEEGTFWTIFAEVDSVLDAQLNKAKVGQDVGVRYTEDKESKTAGFNPTKIRKVFLGDMDPSYQGEVGNEAKPEL